MDLDIPIQILLFGAIALLLLLVVLEGREQRQLGRPDPARSPYRQ